MTRLKRVGLGTCLVAVTMSGAACSDRNGTMAAPAEAVREGGRAADAAMETMDVKAALMRDTRVDAGDINVDTNHETKTVVLKGRVPSAEQKTLAGDIAIAQAKGYRVQNDLIVGAQ